MATTTGSSILVGIQAQTEWRWRRHPLSTSPPTATWSNGIFAGGTNTTGLSHRSRVNGNVTGADGVAVGDGDAGAGKGLGADQYQLGGNVAEHRQHLRPRPACSADEVESALATASPSTSAAAGTDITDAQVGDAGVVAKAGSGNILIDLKGSVGGAAQVGGDGVDATNDPQTSANSSISVTVGLG